MNQSAVIHQCLYGGSGDAADLSTVCCIGCNFVGMNPSRLVDLWNVVALERSGLVRLVSDSGFAFSCVVFIWACINGQIEFTELCQTCGRL